MLTRTIRHGWIFLIFLGLISINCKRQSEQELRTQAQQLESQEKYQDAIKVYGQQIQKYPKGQYADETLQKLAFLYYNHLQDFNQAIAMHTRLVTDFPESKFISQARFMMGYIYANDLKDYDKARTAYTEFLNHHSESELVESVKWELEHLGKDVNEQLKELFSTDKSNSQVKAN